jgi:hypothetical protein
MGVPKQVSLHPTAPGDPSTPRHDASWVNLSFLFNLEFKFLIMSQSFILQGSQMGQTPVFPWGGSPIGGHPSTWLPLHAAGSWSPPPQGVGFLVPAASRPEFRHSPPTAKPVILAVTNAVGTSTWRASPAMGNVSVDGTVMTSFFASSGNTSIHAFPYLYRNLSQCRLTL